MTAPSSLRETLSALRSGELSPPEAVAATAERVERLPAELNPYLAVDFDRALDQARLLTDRDPESLALYGLPVSVKDLEPTQDLPTTWGSAEVEAKAPRADGSLTTRMRAAGCVIYAKTNTPSYGHKDVTDSLVGGVTRNPWDPVLTPGGSSGGAAVVVAAGVDPVAHGTDAAGSVRMPAALTGIAGFKPSYGRLPRVPSMDLWAARGHHGFLGTNVDDLRIVTAALAGGDERDPLSPSERWGDSPVRAPRGRIALVDSLFGVSVDPGVSAVLRQVGDQLTDAGWVIDSPDVGWADPLEWANAYAQAHDYQLLGEAYRVSPGSFSPSQAALIEAGANVTVADLFRYQAERSALHLKATAFLDAYDAVLTPTLPRVAWGVDDDHPSVAGVPVAHGPSGRWADVLLANLTGWPAASIPCGFVDGLPVGLQILSPWRQDVACLELAEQIETVLGPEVRRRPPLHVADLSLTTQEIR